MIKLWCLRWLLRLLETRGKLKPFIFYCFIRLLKIRGRAVERFIAETSFSVPLAGLRPVHFSATVVDEKIPKNTDPLYDVFWGSFHLTVERDWVWSWPAKEVDEADEHYDSVMYVWHAGFFSVAYFRE